MNGAERERTKKKNNNSKSATLTMAIDWLVLNVVNVFVSHNLHILNKKFAQPSSVQTEWNAFYAFDINWKFKIQNSTKKIETKNNFEIAIFIIFDVWYWTKSNRNFGSMQSTFSFAHLLCLYLLYGKWGICLWYNTKYWFVCVAHTVEMRFNKWIFLPWIQSNRSILYWKCVIDDGNFSETAKQREKYRQK